VSVLAIDTASRSRVVVAAATPDGVPIQGVAMRGEAVGTMLPRAIVPLLRLLSHAVVVVTGPGTYTGVRAGMAAAMGIAQARDLPLHGVGALEVAACMPLPDGDTEAWVVADAGRGALYVAKRGEAERPRRILAADFNAGGAPVSSTESLAIDGLLVVDPVEALAAAVALALSRPPLDREGLTALYVD
jgi:tRNA A37 threonylcarbamoyladenosine modification protein TsaB